MQNHEKAENRKYDEILGFYTDRDIELIEEILEIH